jgi:two-component system sensor histidine kinase KdpD
MALVSVLFHLVDNAMKYAPEGEVVVEGEAGEGIVTIAVRDRGPGIPEAERERVFEMFHRLDSRDSREVYGHGLGLHLARKLLETMGGGVRAEAAQGGGARLVFWLPAAPADDPLDEGRAESAAEDGRRGVSGSPAGPASSTRAGR